MCVGGGGGGGGAVIYLLFGLHDLLNRVSIYTNSAHQRVIGLVKITKDCRLLSAPVAQMVKCVLLILTRSTRVRICLLVNFFLLPFQITSEKHLFSIKIKEIIKKLKLKYRVGLG